MLVLTDQNVLLAGSACSPEACSCGYLGYLGSQRSALGLEVDPGSARSPLGSALQTRNPCQHSKIKHIDVPLKDIRKSVSELHELDLCYINTTKQLGDLMTKSLPPKQDWKLSRILMNIPNCDLPASIRKADSSSGGE